MAFEETPQTDGRGGSDVNWIKTTIKYFFISIVITLVFLLLTNALWENWPFVFNLTLLIFVLPVWFESNQLSSLQKVGLMLTLGVVSIFTIYFFSQSKQVHRFLKAYVLVFAVAIPVLLLKRAYFKQKPSRNKPMNK